MMIDIKPQQINNSTKLAARRLVGAVEKGFIAYTFLAGMIIPIHHDLNSAEGRAGRCEIVGGRKDAVRRFTAKLAFKGDIDRRRWRPTWITGLCTPQAILSSNLELEPLQQCDGESG